MIRKWLVKLAVLTGALLVLAFIILATNFFGVFDETWTQEEIEWCEIYRPGVTMDLCSLEFIK